ncbi:putative adhesin [Halorubrum phage HRTV-17]|uniref:Adhesin n=1 Tax=Halorubrum phage HRTV-17 TaxID=2877997 RepID=A0AAE8XRU9_9CAUD|nr:putative adhesin [Halorubrum phage HRTV-17]
MVNYGSGQLGDETISSNTTKNTPVLEYQNLTVQEGVTLTLPSRCRLMVNGTLTVNGTIKVSPDIAGNGTGGPVGGKSGGNLELMAKTIEGAGTVQADGTDGQDGNNVSNQNNGGSGAAYSIPATGASGSGGTAPNRGSNGEYNGNWNGDRNGGNAGSAHSSVYNDSTLKAYLEDYLISGAYITQSPLDTLLPGAGDSGAGGGSRELRQYNNNNNNSRYRTRVEIGGGGGGAGGSFVSKGGVGGNGDDEYINGNNTNLISQDDPNNNSTATIDIWGGESGAGGGAGGFILLVSESVSLDVTIAARGGNGGDGYWGRNGNGRNIDSNGTYSYFNTNEDVPKRDGGGGGGGSGGLVIGFTDKTPTLDLAGGSGGIPGAQRLDGSNSNSNSGSAGQSGVTFLYDIKELL